MTAPQGSCRHAFSAALLELASADPSIFAVCSDSRGSAAMGDFAETLPARFVEVGIAEQNAVGIAAGLASCGKTVFVCGPACFYSSRSLDQVKVDVAYAGTDVKIVGISGGVSYGTLGSTHHALHDLAVMRTFPGLEVFLPCDAASTAAITRYLVVSGKPAYMRLGRAPVSDVYDPTTEPRFVPGRANVLRPGTDGTIVAAGDMVRHAVAAADLLLDRGIVTRVLDCWSISPFDDTAVEAAARETGFIVTVEEHSARGGLGAAVAERVVQSVPVPVRILGFPDEWMPAGSQPELFEHYGFTARGIAQAVLELGTASGRWRTHG